MLYNVEYDDGPPDNPVTKRYLTYDVSLAEAKKWAIKCHEQYVGKRYPNGKGYYLIRNVRVVRVG